MDIAGPKCRVEKLRAPQKYRAHKGDHLLLLADLDTQPRGRVAIEPSFPEIIDQLEIGAQLWINDGKIGARVVAKAKGEAEIEVFGARGKGERLKVEKGLNFPTTELKLPPLTAKDFADLDFVAEHADLIGFSFVQNPSDIELLQDHLAARRGERPPPPLVLKIETPLAVRNLPRLILQSMKHNPTAVMIARGDLAVELGFARLSEMQEEMLWLCEAAHVPVDLGDAGARPVRQGRGVQPLRDDRRGHGAAGGLRHAQQGPPPRRRHRLSAGHSRADGSSPPKEISALYALNRLELSPRTARNPAGRAVRRAAPRP